MFVGLNPEAGETGGHVLLQLLSNRQMGLLWVGERVCLRTDLVLLLLGLLSGWLLVILGGRLLQRFRTKGLL